MSNFLKTPWLGKLMMVQPAEFEGGDRYTYIFGFFSQ